MESMTFTHRGKPCNRVVDQQDLRSITVGLTLGLVLKL